MSNLAAAIHQFIDHVHAPAHLRKYYGGRYTGSLFDTAQELASTTPHSFTASDIAAVATLSVPMSGRAVSGLLGKSADLSRQLAAVRTDLDLASATDEDLAPLFDLQATLDGIHDVGHVTRSKLLAHKRPRLVPIRDQYVLRALAGRPGGRFTVPLRDALASDPSITARLAELRTEVEPPAISDLRVLDVVVWMSVHGDRQVPG